MCARVRARALGGGEGPFVHRVWRAPALEGSSRVQYWRAHPNKRTKISLRPAGPTSRPARWHRRRSITWICDFVRTRVKSQCRHISCAPIDERRGRHRYAPIASFATLCHRRAKHINFRPSRGLTGDDERNPGPGLSLNFVLLGAFSPSLPETRFPFGNVW